MRRVHRFLSDIGDKLMYHAFCMSIKARQFPAILREKRPSFLADEVLSEPISDSYAIVVRYAGFSLGDNYLGLLASLRDAGVNTIIVCNGQPSAADQARLKPYAHRILVRANVGRDMGAYRAATLYLNDRGLRAGRMLYFNDSVLYLTGPSLGDLITRLLNNRYDVVGAFENHQFDYHIGSYVFAVSGTVFHDPRLQRFWRRYRPYDLRTHAINKGEIPLSQQFRRGGYSIDVVYSAERLAQRLYAMDLVSLVGLVQYMRPAFRMHPLDDLVARPLTARRLAKAIADHDESRDSVDSAASGPPTISSYAVRREALRNAPRSTEAARVVTETLARHALIDRLMMEITQSSQIHFGFGLYHRVLDCPLVKKDLLARAIYLEHDCSLILDRLPDDTRAPIMRELVSRGRPLDVRGMRRFLLNHGLV
ncbi:lipopolysaccharide biosynthesis protein [Vineibacter terrae]|uniref:Lipopolysaccharide biosynthesis protein n=1 Tax=Vineibacter terrae TaxID=2586908 RepID=A0A5C8PSN7_9HYPH|nr:rhamnan synthesis F family protein [Vineibacter terrae]TXL78722.1 lipopolysaccharide biosynthesis protein [Vineibacter terrae]